MISINNEYSKAIKDVALAQRINTRQLPFNDGDNVRLQCIKVSSSVMCITNSSGKLYKLPIPRSFRPVFDATDFGETVVIYALYKEYEGSGKNVGKSYAKLIPPADAKEGDSVCTVDSKIEFTRHQDLPITTSIVEIVEVVKSHIVLDIEDVKYKIRLPGHSSWNGVYVDSGDSIIVELVDLGINGLRRTLKFVDYVDVEDTEEKQRKKISPHKKHRWNKLTTDNLIKVANRGTDIDTIVGASKLGFTKGAIYSKLYELGYRVKGGIPYRKEVA